MKTADEKIMRDECPFCTLPETRIIHSNALALLIRDGFPVSAGHSLVLPRRHVASWFDLSDAERSAIHTLLDVARAGIGNRLQPDGYNIGINDGPAAGQTVPHVHVHLIPRYRGDRPDPRGGVRWVLPDKAKYWT